ncbi:uncharacterized protein BCR38DRAFT_414219 [Pseudomassariella vexata]|uniref:GATA-type domain-containing protein n=1 Tax=Pseudomassariella vexata TaxID=1141098 RepID=A0A1Y2DCA8_9PEZI|nr:uncharacterized protein BCR38DRAFT_414219 [Pseudomassariella vexata]ORY56903.1 hypothetical protein BCR38DRAFT_414219 [Pseudomassariella vexata]
MESFQQIDQSIKHHLSFATSFPTYRQLSYTYHPDAFRSKSQNDLVAVAKLSNGLRRKSSGATASSRQAGIKGDKSSPEMAQQREIPIPETVSGRTKKRKSHPACLKCNRSQTPEWRRGPDGPGTLCNVCGLVFAKRESRMKLDC